VAAAGWIIVVMAILPAAAWMALAPLSMAVVAPAFVKVDLNRRPVQHLEGGIVREVLVRDGQKVKAGEPVLVLGDVGVDADRNRLRLRLHIEQATLARLDAEESRVQTLHWPSELREAGRLDERVMRALRKEQSLFDARRLALAAETRLLQEQRVRIEGELNALRAQIAQSEASLGFQQRDLERSRNLLNNGFISVTRLGQIEAIVADYASRLEERRSELERAQQKLLDNGLRLNALQHDYTQRASDEAKVASSRIGELEQELRKSEDAAARQVVVAPAEGEIIDLRFTSPGAVVRAGEPIAEIVPSGAPLTIEAHVRPEEVSHVYRGQRARIRLLAFKYRNDALLQGTVVHVSGDRLVERGSNVPYYSAIVEVGAAEFDQTKSAVQLQAGMPAEVYIEGSKQTPLQYLAEPIVATWRKAGRQM
jgi:HlyD family secretion protein